jgi:membrane protease YdiL (CAAX protease family)
MLTGSLLTGKYSFDPATLSLGQILFALTPGIWEEILFRGVMMVVLLRLTGSFKKAALIQILIFGLAHIKGFGPWDLVDAFSVMVIAFAFTYLAWKTKSLIPGILFHWLHDSFLFVVQLPDGEYAGVTDNLYFYFSLWLFIGLLLLTLRVAGRRFTPDGIHDIYAAAEVES